MLHGEVERGGRFATAAHTHQNHIGYCEVFCRLTIVVCQRKVDGLDAVGVLLTFRNVRETAHAVVGRHRQLGLQRLDEGVEHVQHHALGLGLDQVQGFGVDQGSEDDRLFPFQLRAVVDLCHHLVCFVQAVDEGPSHMSRLDRELRQDGVAKGFGGDAGAIRDKKHSAIGHGVTG